MAKIEKRFDFKFPVNKCRNREVLFFGNLQVSYVGYEYTHLDPEDRYDVDVDSVKWEGAELIGLLCTEQFSIVMDQITDAALNNVEHQFYDYHQDQLNELAEMQYELRRIS